MNELVYWIWLSLSCTPGTQTFKKLIQKFNAPKAIYEADKNELLSIVSDKTGEREALQNKSLDEAEKIFSFCERHKVGLLIYSDARYPNSLKEIKAPPVLLYYRGVLPDFNKHCSIAIVGTRRLSSYGRKNAYDISRDLASAGALVISGMAIGIDGMAAAGALSANAPTVAVLGSGINICYPKQHLMLAQNIVKTGCVLTEYPPNSEPAGFHFPKRNRIISGIAKAVIVVEGTDRSGALITAELAKEEGRPVYALPGYVGNKNSEASNLLIREGAYLVTSADDVIRDLDKKGEKRLNPFKMPQKRNNDMFDVMTKYQISALTPDDDIFKPSRKRITSRDALNVQNAVKSANEQRTPDDEHGAYTFVRQIPENLQGALTNAQHKPITLQTSANEQHIPNNVQILANEQRSFDEPARHKDSIKDVKAEKTGLNFDAKTLKIYKRIPEGVECSYESLAGDGISITDVVTSVLKLQVCGFVTLHPGDFVSRKFKY